MQVYLPLFVVIHRSSAGEFPNPCFHLRLEFGVDSQGKPFLNMLPYSYWALTCSTALPTYSAFMIFVRQASDLPPASFRFPVIPDTLALVYILPAVGRIRDFHPLKHAPAGRTSSTGEHLE